MMVGQGTTETTRRQTRARVALAGSIVVGVLALLIASCGGDGDDTSATLTPSPTRGPSPTRTSVARASATPNITGIAMQLDEFVIRPNQTRALPDTINFVIENAGEVPHEFVVIKSDLKIAELPRLPGDEGVDESNLDVEGRLEEPLESGAEGTLSLDLEVGKYILICNLAPNGESHYLNGMYTAFEVRTDVPASTATPTP
jgi:uncharacterized cupredoxin-like copper-binding protein